MTNTFEQNTFTKQGYIEKYRIMAKMFYDNPTMECSVAMNEQANYLINIYGITADEIEAIELSVMI